MKNSKYYNSDAHLDNIKKAGLKSNEKIQLLKQERIQKYFANPKLCLYCQNPIDYYKQRANKYCSHKCRASEINPTKGKQRTEKEKQKISKTLSGRELTEEHINKLKGNKNGQYKRKLHILSEKFGYTSNIYKRRTNNKNKPIVLFEKYFKKNYATLSERRKAYWDAHPEKKLEYSKNQKGKKLSEQTIKKIKERAQERIKNGTHKGWSSRSNPSYPEKFFMKVLENNEINYEFELKCGKYFIDFAITAHTTTIALEIDGKQHEIDERKKSDEIKDMFLSDNGWSVYRIKWKSLNTETGKNYIKNEIDKFIKYYKSKFASVV